MIPFLVSEVRRLGQWEIIIYIRVKLGVIKCQQCRSNNLTMGDKELTCHECGQSWPITDEITDLKMTVY